MNKENRMRWRKGPGYSAPAQDGHQARALEQQELWSNMEEIQEQGMDRSSRHWGVEKGGGV